MTFINKMSEMSDSESGNDQTDIKNKDSLSELNINIASSSPTSEPSRIRRPQTTLYSGKEVLALLKRKEALLIKAEI